MNNCISVSWIYEQFIALHVKHGKPIAQWNSPDKVIHLGDFEKALSASCKAFKLSKGSDIVIAYEADDHVHTRISTPCMSLRDTKKYLVRQLNKLGHSIPPAWSYQISTHQKSKQSIVLHTLPGEMLNNLCRISNKNHLVLRRLVPLADLAALEYANTKHKSNYAALLVLLFESKTQMMIVNKDNEVLIIRELDYHWSDNSHSRVSLDINRSILYAKQQYNIHLESIHLLGTEALQAHTALQTNIKQPISINESALNACFWANTASSLPLKSSSNFVPASMQRKITSLHLYKMAKWASLSLSAAALCIVFFIESLVSQYGSITEAQHQSVSELEHQLKTLKEQHLFQQNRQVKQKLTTLNNPPIPLWFVGRLDQFITDKTTLSHVKVGLKQNTWEFLIEGITQADLAQSHDIFRDIETRLTAPPWNATVAQTWQDEWLQKLHKGDAAKEARVSFLISGEMQ